MYEVIKEYAGIEVGTKVNSKKESNCRKMVEKGYWKKIEHKKANVKIEPEIPKRLKKVEKVTRNKK